jgi:glycerol-3-phosphate dehydrogenase
MDRPGVTDKALDALGIKRRKDTKGLSVGGGRAYPKTDQEKGRLIDALSAWTGLPTVQVKILFDRYGTRAEQVCSYIAREPDEPLKTLPSYTRREVIFLGTVEKALHLEDVILRRTMLALLGEITRERLDELAQVLGDSLGWNSKQRHAEVARTLEVLRSKHGIRL